MKNRRNFLKKTGIAGIGIAGSTMIPAFGIGHESMPDQSKSTENDSDNPIRVGMIGLDTSHVIAFTKVINDPEDFNPDDVKIPWYRADASEGRPPYLDRINITAAFPGGNPDFPPSRDRIEGFTEQVRDFGVNIVNSIEELLPLVDAVMLMSVCGTQHLEQARPVFAAGKPLFIDKPLAASLEDVLAIADLGKKYNVPWFHASSSRYTPGYPELRNNPEIGNILGCDVYSQSRAVIGHPDLFWYGVHGVDLLFSLMGTGCKVVTAVQTHYTEQVKGVWEKGYLGNYRGIRSSTGRTGLGATVFGDKGIKHVNNLFEYHPLITEIAKFFINHQPPVSVDEMVEMFAYMEAAEESKRRGSTPVRIEEVLESRQKLSFTV